MLQSSPASFSLPTANKTPYLPSDGLTSLEVIILLKKYLVNECDSLCRIITIRIRLQRVVKWNLISNWPTRRDIIEFWYIKLKQGPLCSRYQATQQSDSSPLYTLTHNTSLPTDPSNDLKVDQLSTKKERKLA